jgi:two-component system CheB/CheR fusion protein
MNDHDNPAPAPSEKPLPENWDLLMEVVEDVSAANSLEDLQSRLCKATRRIADADGVTFVMRDGAFCHYMAEDAVSPLWRGRRFPLVSCISGWCMLEGKAAVISDITVDLRIPQEAYKPTFVKSLVMTPIGVKDPIAALGVYWAKHVEPSRATIRMLEMVAHSAANALAAVLAA